MLFSGLIARGKHWRLSSPRWLALNIITSWFEFYSLLILFAIGYWTFWCWERERTSRIQHIFFLLFFWIRIGMELIAWWLDEKYINVRVFTVSNKLVRKEMKARRNKIPILVLKLLNLISEGPWHVYYVYLSVGLSHLRSAERTSIKLKISWILRTTYVFNNQEKDPIQKIRTYHWMFEMMLISIFKFYIWGREQQILKCEEIVRSVYKKNTILFLNKAPSHFITFMTTIVLKKKNLKLSWMWLAYSIWSTKD